MDTLQTLSQSVERLKAVLASLDTGADPPGAAVHVQWAIDLMKEQISELLLEETWS